MMRLIARYEKVNDFVGEYLCALPTFNSLAGYRAYHMAHHRLAGTVDDPDLHMTKQYPVSKASLQRKLCATSVDFHSFILSTG